MISDIIISIFIMNKWAHPRGLLLCECYSTTTIQYIYVNEWMSLSLTRSDSEWLWVWMMILIDQLDTYFSNIFYVSLPTIPCKQYMWLCGTKQSFCYSWQAYFHLPVLILCSAPPSFLFRYWILPFNCLGFYYMFMEIFGIAPILSSTKFVGTCSMKVDPIYIEVII